MLINGGTAAISLRTGIERGPRFAVINYRKLAAASDGALWASDGNRVAVWSPTRAELVRKADVREPGGSMQPLAAVSGALAYALHMVNDTAAIVPITASGIGAPLAPLPSGKKAVRVAAAADGTVWTMDDQGAVFSKSGSGGWTSVALPPNAVVDRLSVGSANFAAVTATRGPMRYVYTFNGTTWTEGVGLPTQLPLWVGACDDGTYWRASGGVTLDLVLSADKTVSFPMSQQASMYNNYAAGGRYGCYFQDGFDVSVATYGVLDEPKDGFPALTAGESAAYDAINTHLRISDPAGLRGMYRNMSAPISAWNTSVQQMARPTSVTEADWNAVRDAISAELTNVEAVRNLFVNLKILNVTVGQRISDTRAEVTAMIGLPEEEHDQPATPIDLALGKLLDKVFDAAIQKVPAPMSKAVNVVVSLAKNAADKEAKALGAPDAGTTIQIACAKLATTLAKVQTSTLAGIADAVNTLLTNGKQLSAAGNAIASGIWFWPTDFDVKVVTDAGARAELQMYQMLMPVRWSILRFMTLFTPGGVVPSPRPFPTHAPAVALMFKKVLDDKANMLCWWWVCAAEGAPPKRETTGPFPNKALLEKIMTLVRPEEFFTGAGEWKLPVHTQDGWVPPPEGLAFEGWVDVDKPLQ